MHSFIKKKLPSLNKNCIGPTYKKTEPWKSGFIKTQVLKLIESTGGRPFGLVFSIHNFKNTRSQVGKSLSNTPKRGIHCVPVIFAFQVDATHFHQ